MTAMNGTAIEAKCAMRLIPPMTMKPMMMTSAIAVAQVGTFQAFSIAPEIALDWIPGSMKDMARGGFDIGRRGARQGRDPQPHHGTGPAEADGGGDAGDVADSDAAGQRDRQRLEGRDSLIGALAAEHLGEDGRDLSDLHRSR